MGQLEEAAADIKKALELNPDVWPGDSMLSQIYVLQGRLQGCSVPMSRFCTLLSDPSVKDYMAIAATALGASFLWLCWETRKVGKLATSVDSARADAKNLFHRLSRTRRQHHAGHVHNSYGSPREVSPSTETRLPQTARLPNPAAFLRVHGLAFGTSKRFAELFEVLHGAVDAPPSR